MRNVLVALDDSEASERVATFVDDFFAGGDFKVTAVSVALMPVAWIPPATPFGFVYAWGPATRMVLAADQERVPLARAETTVESSDLDADETLTKIGDPVQSILDAAEETNADVIVVGSNNKGFFERLVFGSVSDQILKDPDRPILLVP